jgi:hypothetical protein
VDSLACPQCGAALEAAPDEGVTRCGHCGASLRVIAVERRHEWLVPALGPREAQAALRRTLAEREAGGAPDVQQTRLVFFPFARREGPHGPRLSPAASTLLEELEEFRHPAGDCRGFEAAALAARGDVIAVEGEPEADLLHVPFHVVRFRLPGRVVPSEAWVDAVGGQVLFESPPPTRERDLDVGYAALVAAVFLAMVVCARLVWSGGVETAVGVLGLGACFWRGQDAVRAAMRRAESA